MTIGVGPKMGLLVTAAPGEGHFAQLTRFLRGVDGFLGGVTVLERIAGTTMPVNVPNGGMFLITSGTNANNIARRWVDDQSPGEFGWEYFTPFDGLKVWSTADQKTYRYRQSTTSWIEEEAGGGGGSAGQQSISVSCSDLTTDLTTGVGKAYLDMPYNFSLDEVQATVFAVQNSGNILTVDINANGSSILSTKLTIDNAEVSSLTAATSPVISSSTLTKGQRITFDIDQVGGGGAKGLIVTLVGTPQ